MYPVKVYDKHGNLIKEYNQEELNKKSDEMFNKGKNKYRDKQKAFYAGKNRKKEEEGKAKEKLEELLDNLKKGTSLCKPAPSDLKSDKAPHSGKSKDTTGESGKE